MSYHALLELRQMMMDVSDPTGELKTLTDILMETKWGPVQEFAAKRAMFLLDTAVCRITE